MYECTSKEIREKFKETEYGKKTNNWVTLIAIITILILIIGEAFVFLYMKKIINISHDLFIYITGAIGLIFIILCIVACYFDGKRDGAIEQFKRDIKIEKNI